MKSQRPRVWDAIGSLRLEFTAYEWNELFTPDSNDTIYHYMPPVASLNLSLPERDFIETIDDDWPRVLIPKAFLAHLTTFTLKCDWDGNSVLTTLQDCINLESLTLDFDSSHDIEFDFDQPLLKDGLMLPTLRTLRFRHIQEESMLQILEILNAPALEELDICGHLWNGSEKFSGANWDQHILAATKRGGCALRRLRIHFVAFDGKELYHLLRQLPSLEYLCLENVTFKLDIFQGLKSGSYLPKLEVLELLGPSMSQMGELGGLLHHFLQDEVPMLIRPGGPQRKLTSVKRLRLVLREPEALNFQYLEREGR
ncbi:hypothetical protein H1R20_g14603, partial [Candolleomyces eurysporus]